MHGKLSDIIINNFDFPSQSNLITNKKNVASDDLISINDDTLNDRHNLLVENLSDWARKMLTLTGINSESQFNKFAIKDLFIGFKYEILQSLIMDIIKNNPEADNNRVLETCKECLIATVSSDGIVRAERSALERDEVDRWKHVYFHQQHHESLYDYFANQENLLSDLNGNLVIIYTFSNIDTDVRSCLQELIKHFWLESNDRILILQCDATTANTENIKLAKCAIEQFRNESITKKDQMEPMKHACIIFHIHRDQESTFESFNFVCDWKKMTIETLSGNDIPIFDLLEGSLSYIIDSAYPFEEIFLQELLWCLSCMNYPSNGNSANHIKLISEKIPNFIKCLKDKTLKWIEENSTSDWQYKIASNKRELYSYSSFSAAIQAHIRKFVRKTIAKILYYSSFGNKFIWIREIIKIEDIQDDGYNMSAGCLLDLEFPFSFYFIDQIDSFKRYYEEELPKDYDRIDSKDHLKDFKYNLLTSIPQLKDSLFEWKWTSKLYFNDFVTVIASRHGQLQLARMFPLIIKNIEIQGNTIAGGNLEKHLVRGVIKLMLMRICDNFELIDKWQRDITGIISIVNKLMRAETLPDFQLLHFVNDLVSTKSIPFDNVREIVRLELSLDKQEVFSEKFINTMLDKLVIKNFEESIRLSARLNIINECLRDLDTNMATLCCDTIEQTFFMNKELENLTAYFGPVLEALYKQERPSLQKITSIALLKEFVRRFWDNFIQEDRNSFIAEENNFDDD
ncbi:unnamed protein product [Rhizophagus irregularis]|nr:unnamed protein product [Rhizophagus irregularis]